MDSKVFVVVGQGSKALQVVAGRDYELARMVLEFRRTISRMQPQAKYPPIPEDEPE